MATQSLTVSARGVLCRGYMGSTSEEHSRDTQTQRFLSFVRGKLPLCLQHGHVEERRHALYRGAQASNRESGEDGCRRHCIDVSQRDEWRSNATRPRERDIVESVQKSVGRPHRKHVEASGSSQVHGNFPLVTLADLVAHSSVGSGVHEDEWCP